MIIKLIDISIFRGTPTSPAGTWLNKPSHVSDAESGKVHYKLLAKLCENEDVKHETRSMNKEEVKVNLFMKLFENNKSRLEWDYLSLILSAFGADTPTFRVTCQSPVIQPGPNPSPNPLAGVMGAWDQQQLGGTPPGSNAVSWASFCTCLLFIIVGDTSSGLILGVVEMDLFEVGAIFISLGDDIIVITIVTLTTVSSCGLATDIILGSGLINSVTIIGEIILICNYILNHRLGAGAYVDPAHPSGRRLLSTLMLGLQIDYKPLTTGVDQLNAAVLLMTTHAYSSADVLTSGVEMKVTRIVINQGILFMKMTILNQVYLEFVLFGVKY